MKKKLALVRETLVSLTPETLDGVNGGASIPSAGGGVSQTQASLCIPPSRTGCDTKTQFFCVPEQPR